MNYFRSGLIKLTNVIQNITIYFTKLLHCTDISDLTLSSGWTKTWMGKGMGGPRPEAISDSVWPNAHT